MNIKNDTLLQDFLNHLELEGNNDIIFSAPFGTGKTYFLKEDFVPKCEEHYNAIHLYPVNYSVSSNEDNSIVRPFQLWELLRIRSYRCG